MASRLLPSFPTVCSFTTLRGSDAVLIYTATSRSSCCLRRRGLIPAVRAPLRPLTLYTMLVVAYCAGLRLGEIVGLELRDIDLQAGTIDVRDTKFFKSRRLPLSPSAMTALRNYLFARRKAGASQETQAPLFVHEKGGYSQITAGALLKNVIRRAGLNTGRGRGGPRIHDIRHTFVVHG